MSVPTPEAPSDLKYWAFLSYNHHDRKFVEKVLDAIEGYRLPKDLVGKPGPDGPVPKRLKVYRDRDESRAAPDLSEELQIALRRSRYMVVVCSPASAALRFEKDGVRTSWVNEEIRCFQRMGRADRILTIIKEGEPNASDPDKGKAECYPPALTWKVNAAGEPTGERTVPSSADARPRGDGFHNAVLKVIARIVGVDYDTLKRRDEIRRKRAAALLVLAAAVFAGALVAAGLAWRGQREAVAHEQTAVEQKRIADQGKQEADAQTRAAPFLSAAAERRSQGGHGTAALLSARALVESDRVPASPQTIVNDLAAALVPSGVYPRRSRLWRSAWNGSTLALGDDTGHVQAWQWRSAPGRWECAWLSAAGHGEPLPNADEVLPTVRDMAWTAAEGGAFLSAGEDGTLRAFRASDGEQLWSWPSKDEQGVVHHLVSVAVEPTDGEQAPRIVVGDAEGGLWMLPWRPKDSARRWQAHQGWPRTVRWQPGGKMFASASADGTLRLWDREGHELRALRLPQGTARLLVAAFSPDGKWVAAGGDAGIIGVWEAETGTLRGQMKALEPLDKDYSGVKALAWLDGQRLLSGAADGRIVLWDASSGARIREVSGAAPDDPAPAVFWIEALDHGQLAVTRWAGLSIVDLETGRTLHRMDGLTQNGLTHGGSSTDDGKYLAVSLIDAISWVRVYDLEAERVVRAFPSPKRSLAEAKAFPAPVVGLSQDGGRIAWNEPRGVIRVSSVENGETLHLLKGAWTDNGAKRFTREYRPLLSLAWSTDGKLLASCGPEVRVWNAAGAFEEIRQVPLQMARALQDRGLPFEVQCAFIPRTEQLAILEASGHEVRLWDARRGAAPVKVLGGLPPDAQIESFSVSQEGRFFAAGTATGLVGVWSTQTAKLLRITRVTPEAVERPQQEGSAPVDPGVAWHGKVMSLAFSPNTAALAVGLGDGSLRILHTQTGRVLAHAPGVEGRRSPLSVVSELFTPTGRLVTLGGDDGALRFWNRGWTQRPAGKLGQGAMIFSAHGVSASPDGTAWIATRGAAHSGQMWDAQGKPQCNVYALGLRVSAATWLSDGTRAVLATTGGELVVVRREGETCTVERRVPAPPGAEALVTDLKDRKDIKLWAMSYLGLELPVTELVVDQEHHLLASLWIGNAVWLLDLATWQWRPKPLRTSADGTREGFLLVQATPRPGHAEMAAIERSGKITLWSTTDGRVRWEAKGQTASLDDTPIAFSPDGEVLAAGGDASDVLLFDADSGALLGQFPAHGTDARGAYRVPSVRWLHKGSMLATVGADNLLRLWEISEQAGERSGKLAGLAPVFPLPFVLSGVPEGSSPAERAELSNPVEPDEIPGLLPGVAVAQDDRTIAVASSEGVLLFDADALVADMRAVTERKGPELLRWVEERTGLRLVEGQQAMLRYSNALVPQAESPAGRMRSGSRSYAGVVESQ